MSNNTMKQNTLEMKGGAIWDWKVVQGYYDHYGDGGESRTREMKDFKTKEALDELITTLQNTQVKNYIAQVKNYIGNTTYNLPPNSPLKQKLDSNETTLNAFIGVIRRTDKNVIRNRMVEERNKFDELSDSDWQQIKAKYNILEYSNPDIDEHRQGHEPKDNHTYIEGKPRWKDIYNNDSTKHDGKLLAKIFLNKVLQEMILTESNGSTTTTTSATGNTTVKTNTTTITLETSDNKSESTDLDTFLQEKMMDKFYEPQYKGTDDKYRKNNNYDRKDDENVIFINSAVAQGKIDPSKLDNLEHLHTSDVAIQNLINDTSSKAAAKAAKIINDRYFLLEKLKKIFTESDDKEQTQFAVVVPTDPTNNKFKISIQPDLFDELYGSIASKFNGTTHYQLTSWIKQDKKNPSTETFPRTIIKIEKVLVDKNVKLNGKKYKESGKLNMTIIYNQLDSDNSKKTHKEDSGTTINLILYKASGEKVWNRLSKITKAIPGVTGGKTHKRKPKATKKKNRPVKQKFTRKHRGGMSMGEFKKQGPILVDFYERLDESLANDNAKKLATSLKNAEIYAMTKRGARRINGNILKKKVTGQNKEIRDEFLMDNGYYQMNNKMMKVSAKVGGILKKRDPKLTITFSEQMFIDPAIWLDNQVGKDDSWIDTYLDAQDGKKVFKNTSENVSEYNKIKTDIKGFVDKTLTLNPLKDPKTATLMRRQITDAIKNEKLTNITNEEYLANEKYKNLNSIFDLFTKHSDHTHDMSKTNIHINNGLIKTEKEERELLADQFTGVDQTDSKPSETVTEPSSTEAPTDLPKPDDTPEFIPQVTKEKKED